MEYGPERLLKDLNALGFAPEKTVVNGTEFIILPSYEVSIGKFSGRVIDLGLQCTTDFPRSVHSSIHVKAEPQLYEKTDSKANVRNINDSSLGQGWLYWSINFNWNTQSEKTARRLVSQINTIFERS
ncbi:MAG: hypothetical protein COY01_02940 [Candidatus Pacebacteria bacterium CG_4_10_14_0_2_um_filter_40_20]|nr:MAG: hypothetical protein COY01_02940 [Candidatus Pacebacteria bacterium CG_4_10_14_0_2_um_filter_40_20]